jgi:ubiquinone/menaquinone biosynthesis C-methylase UbiE
VADELAGFDAKLTYDAAAEAYEDASRDYWQYLSRRTVARLGLKPGESVLDVACGTGPATVAAAQAVGENGRVLAVDYAEQMLAIAREKVARLGVGNVELRAADITALELEEGSFDAVLSVLGIFFFDDMRGFLESLWRWTRPGGRVAITVLGTRFFDPLRDVFVDAVQQIRPDVEVVEPWRRTDDPAVVGRLFDGLGADVSIETEDERLPLPSADDWWRIVMGSGLRRTITSLRREEAAEVRARCNRFVEEHRVHEVVLRGHYALARKRAS